MVTIQARLKLTPIKNNKGMGTSHTLIFISLSCGVTERSAKTTIDNGTVSQVCYPFLPMILAQRDIGTAGATRTHN